MKFDEVLPAMRAGKKITCDDNEYYFMKDGVIFFHENGKDYPYGYSPFFHIDVLSDKWRIVEELKCELCGGSRKIIALRLDYFDQDKTLRQYPTIDCPECK